MDGRDHAHQTGGTGHGHLIMQPRIYRAAVRWIYAPARMDAGLWKIHELFCGCKSFFIRLGLPVAAEKRRCLFLAL